MSQIYKNEGGVEKFRETTYLTTACNSDFLRSKLTEKGGELFYYQFLLN